MGKPEINFDACKKGGLARSEKKTKSARENGTKGGRPRSTTPTKGALYMREYRKRRLDAGKRNDVA
jgi:hypothetical protein